MKCKLHNSDGKISKCIIIGQYYYLFYVNFKYVTKRK